MHFKLYAISALALTQSALGAIAMGENRNDNLAWIEGESECSRAIVINAKGNFCGRQFRLLNQQVYEFRGCGGSVLTLHNADGSVNSVCHGADRRLACDVQRRYICG